MDSQALICIATERAKVYYHCLNIATEYLDHNGHVVKTEGVIPDGAVREFFAVTECDKAFASGKLNGQLSLIDSKTKRPILIENYSNGRLEGIRIGYYENGRVRFEENFKEGRLHGLAREFFDNGELYIEENYENGALANRKEHKPQGELIIQSPPVPMKTTRISSVPVESKRETALAPPVPSAAPQPAQAAPAQTQKTTVSGSPSTVAPSAATKPPAQQAPPSATVRAAGDKETIRKVTEQERIYFVNNAEVARETLNSDGAVIETKGSIPDGLVREYYRNGNIKIEENYERGLLSGLRRKYDESGRIWAEETYVEGKREGVVRIRNYFKDKVFLEEAYYKDNRLDGTRRTHYPSGTVSVEETYKDNKLDGLRKTFYENGNINVEENYKEDRLEGARKRYYENGQLWNEEHHSDGKLEGTRTDYYPTGQLRVEENYHGGKLEGARKFYYDTGKPMYEENYSQGKLIDRKEFRTKFGS